MRYREAKINHSIAATPDLLTGPVVITHAADCPVPSRFSDIKVAIRELFERLIIYLYNYSSGASEGPATNDVMCSFQRNAKIVQAYSPQPNTSTAAIMEQFQVLNNKLDILSEKQAEAMQKLAKTTQKQAEILVKIDGITWRQENARAARRNASMLAFYDGAVQKLSLPLLQLKTDEGEISPLFPSNCNQFYALDNQQLRALLDFYGIERVNLRSLSERRDAFKKFVCYA